MTVALHENARLAELATLVLPGRPALDVGTDHARLPMALIDRSICPRVIASDHSRAVIARLRITLRDSRFADRIEPVHADGLDALEGRRAATVVIAGIGGHTIVEMLTRGHRRLADVERLVIAPQRDTPGVRRWLHANAWRPADERLVESRGRFYWILAHEPAGVPAEGPLDDVDAALGAIARRRGDAGFLRFATAESRWLEQALSELAGARAPRSDARRRELERRLRVLREALDGIAVGEQEAPCTSSF